MNNTIVLKNNKRCNNEIRMIATTSLTNRQSLHCIYPLSVVTVSVRAVT